MSFTLPHIFKSPSQLPASMEHREVELPVFDNPEAIKVLPYDKAVSDVAEKALQLAGMDILRTKYGVTDTFAARNKIHEVVTKVGQLGFEAVHAHEPLLDVTNVDTGDIVDMTPYRLVTLREDAPLNPRAGKKTKLDRVRVLPEGVESESELVPSQIEELWKEKALQGEDASLVLLSLKKLANTPEQGFASSRAAELISDIHADDTRIALK